MNNKKITVLFVLIAVFILLGIIGFTIAYFSSSTDFANEFKTGKYEVIATEVFESPENWLPGQTIPKTLVVTNNGEVDVKVRVCLNEEWKSYNGDDLPLEQNGDRVAIINYSNNYNWYLNGNCYYYYENLEPGGSTDSFISGVTLNPDLEPDLRCNNITETKQRCASSGDSYDKGKYKLTLTVETVQVDHYLAWGGYPAQEVTIADEHFYVLDSDPNTTTTLISKYNLYVGDIYDISYNDENSEFTYTFNKTLTSSDTGYGLQSSNAKGFDTSIFDNTTNQFVGVVPFSGEVYWEDILGDPIARYITNIYDSSLSTIAPQLTYDQASGIRTAQDNGYTIAYYVEEYVRKLKQLGAPSTITGRLLSKNEFDDYIGNFLVVYYNVSDHNKCESYFSQLWNSWDNTWESEYGSGNVVSFCNGGPDYYGYTLENYLMGSDIDEEEYESAGISDVSSGFLLSNGSYWLGSKNNMWNAQFDGMEFICHNDNYDSVNSGNISSTPAYNVSNLFGVRVVIEIPTSELKEHY